MDLLSRVSLPPLEDGEAAMIEAASACLDRFTDRFNACDTRGVDAELHFPHLLLSGHELITWPAPGGHSGAFFDALKHTGWLRTRYDDKLPVLVCRDKVHFVVAYSRIGCDDVPISRHRNLWIVSRIGNRWGICLRSY